MRIAIFGAGGIIGQTLRRFAPVGHEIRYYRRHADPLHYGGDLTQPGEVIDKYAPDVILNLAGENRPDVVERTPGTTRQINVDVPDMLAAWCDAHDSHYIHISSQAVFSGDDPPYGPESPLSPINKYGEQKAEAEALVRQRTNWTIVRPTFVLGIRPLPHVGRQNPLEQMLENPNGQQVDDRWFSPVFADELANALWYYVTHTSEEPAGMTYHFGRPRRVSRHDIAMAAGCNPIPASHDSFPCPAQRPEDTTYADGSIYLGDSFEMELERCLDMRDGQDEKALEIALFLEMDEAAARRKLAQGFGPLHKAVSDDFDAANPQTDEALLDWYRGTTSYIWELTAYHEDAGYNYTGMVKGIVDRLKGIDGEVLCLGDGVGTVTLALRDAGVKAVYHDLAGSRTAAFAEFRLWRRHGRVGDTECTPTWEPALSKGRYAATVSLDFMEHVTDVPAWTRAIHESLKPGGVSLFQNAFGLGSGPDGGMPMHLERNDRYIKEWTPLMAQVGYAQVGTSNWWMKDEVQEKAA